MTNTEKPSIPPEGASTSMSVEEARSVLWLRNKRRPLGELLDEGYLNEKRLAWAAERAYDPRLKQAAAVLLDWLKQSSQQPQPQTEAVLPFPGSGPAQTIDAGITIEDARATPWPFKPFKGQQMGALVDARQITLKDLAYAIENAWDERVKRAAIALAAVCLNQAVSEPPPPAGPLKVVSSGRSFAERRQLFLAMVQGLFAGLVIGVSLPLAIQWLLKLRRPYSANPPSEPLSEILASPQGVIALLIILLLSIGAIGMWWVLLPLVLKKLDRAIENYRKGQEGEELVVETLRQNLDGNWTLFRNVTLPGRKRTDIDAVLVGPPGVWTLEVKMLSGEYRNVGEHWEVRAGRRWKLLRQSPSHRAQHNAVRLANFLRADSIHQWVTPAVVWANPASALTVENPLVAVWTFDRLPEELGNLWREQVIEEEKRKRIVEKLTALCQPKKENG